MTNPDPNSLDVGLCKAAECEHANTVHGEDELMWCVDCNSVVRWLSPSELVGPGFRRILEGAVDPIPPVAAPSSAVLGKRHAGPWERDGVWFRKIKGRQPATKVRPLLRSQYQEDIRCGTAGCNRLTKERKPHCTAHVRSNPHAHRVLAAIDQHTDTPTSDILVAISSGKTTLRGICNLTGMPRSLAAKRIKSLRADGVVDTYRNKRGEPCARMARAG